MPESLDIDDVILVCHFDVILTLLDGYAICLQSGRHADNLVAHVAHVIERRFESHIINVRPDHVRYCSLTSTQLQIIRTMDS